MRASGTPSLRGRRRVHVGRPPPHAPTCGGGRASCGRVRGRGGQKARTRRRISATPFSAVSLGRSRSSPLLKNPRERACVLADGSEISPPRAADPSVSRPRAGLKGELLEQTFEERLVLRVFAPAEVADGGLAALQRLGVVADYLLELRVGATVLVLADGLEQVVLEVVVALRVVEREQQVEVLLLAAV